MIREGAITEIEVSFYNNIKIAHILVFDFDRKEKIIIKEPQGFI